MADIAIFRINYKSDFILTLQSDAGWLTPFCIKFWTGAPSQAYYAYYDGMSYTHCAPVDGEPTKLLVQFDDHHLPIGDLKFQIGYHFTVADFPTAIEDEVINQASVIIEVDDAPAQVMLDFNGETAPEIQFALPAYANEAQRIANEQARIAAEEQRIANEQARISAEETRQANEQQRINQEAARVNEFARLKTESEAATDAATSAANTANASAQNADEKAALAQSAATLANAKAQLAADKAALAQAAATLANEKAALAQQKAEYAQEQGDAAKTEAETAHALNEEVRDDEEARDQAEQIRQQQETARQQAESQRVTDFNAQMQQQQTAYANAEAVRDTAFDEAETERDAKVDEKVADITNLQAQIGYFICDTASATAAKTIAATGYALTTGGNIRIKMTNANTADAVTLNINSTGAKALFYNGAQASSTNSWEAGEVVEVYYDGTKYQCGGRVVDDEPTAGSNNSVKSGGVSNMYGHYSNHPEYLYVITDNDGHLLFAIKCDGDIVFSIGVPNQVKEYVESAIDAILEGNDTEKIDCINDIYNFLKDYSTSDSLKQLLDLKVDKELNKSLISNQYVKEHEAEEYITVCTDADGKILYAVKKDGDFIFGCKIPKSIIGENAIIINNSRLRQSNFNKTNAIYVFFGCNTLDESIVLPADCKFVFIGDAYINLNGFKFTGTLLNRYITTSQFGLIDKELDISAFNNLYSLNICPIHMDRDYELADNTNYLYISSYKDLDFRKHNIKVTTQRSKLVLFYQSANYVSANRFENLNIDCNYLASKGFNYNGGTRLGIVNNIRIINATKYGISFGSMGNFTPTKFPDGTDIPDRHYGGNLKASGIDVWFSYNDEYPSAPQGSVGITLGIADSFFKDLCAVRYETGIYVKITTNIEEAHPWGGTSGDGTGDDLRVIGFAVCYGACAHLTNCHFDGYYYGLLLDNRSYVTIQDGVWYRGDKVHNGSKLIIDGRFTHPDEYDKGVNVYEGIHAVVNGIFQRGIDNDRGVLCSDALVNHVTGSGMIAIPNEV